MAATWAQCPVDAHGKKKLTGGPWRQWKKGGKSGSGLRVADGLGEWATLAPAHIGEGGEWRRKNGPRRELERDEEED